MNNVSWYEVTKIFGIALSALLGAIGVLGDFRTEDKTKISRYGYIMIAGIIVSGTLTIVATAHDDHSQDERVHELILNTKTLVSGAKATVADVHRLLSVVLDPTFNMKLTVDCTPPITLPACEHAKTILVKYEDTLKNKPHAELEHGEARLHGSFKVIRADGSAVRTEGYGFTLSTKALTANRHLRLLAAGAFVISLYPIGANPRVTHSIANYLFDMDTAIRSGALRSVEYWVSASGRWIDLELIGFRPLDTIGAHAPVSFQEIRGGHLIFSNLAPSTPMMFIPKGIEMQSSNGQTFQSGKFSEIARKDGVMALQSSILD